MATIRELLEAGDLGGSEKTASAMTATDADGMDKLAMELGLFEDTTEKVAAEEEEGKEEEDGEKKAGIPTGNLHSVLFPDSVLGGAEKTAAEKQAAAEEALGGMAYDQFASVVDKFIEKLASEIISENPHADSQPSNRLPNNKPGNAKQKIDTAPQVTNMLPAHNDASTVGNFEQKTASAFRKHWLLSQLSA